MLGFAVSTHIFKCRYKPITSRVYIYNCGLLSTLSTSQFSCRIWILSLKYCGSLPFPCVGSMGPMTRICQLLHCNLQIWSLNIQSCVTSNIQIFWCSDFCRMLSESILTALEWRTDGTSFIVLNVTMHGSDSSMIFMSKSVIRWSWQRLLFLHTNFGSPELLIILTFPPTVSIISVLVQFDFQS